MFCDKEVSVHCINSGVAHNRVLQSCVKELHWIAAKNDCQLRVVYLRLAENRAADALLRWHLHPNHQQSFWRWARGRQFDMLQIQKGGVFHRCSFILVAEGN